MENLPNDTISLPSRVFYSPSEDKLCFGEVGDYKEIPTNHNDLNSIQGGTVTQRYHLDEAEYEFVQGISPFRNPPQKSLLVFDTTLPPATIAIGNGSDDSVATFGEVKQESRSEVVIPTSDNELVPITQSNTLIIINDLAITTVRISDPSGSNKGALVRVKNTNSGTVETETLDDFFNVDDGSDATGVSLNQNTAVLISDGNQWQLVSTSR